MKLTCMMIIAVLFLTAWTFVMADDSNNGLANHFSKSRDEMEDPEASKLEKRRDCQEKWEYCIVPILGFVYCCAKENIKFLLKRKRAADRGMWGDCKDGLTTCFAPSECCSEDCDGSCAMWG
uniref:Conotoxin Superfamily O1 n=1 Tax=Conus episcopatus TaxID=88764 RepID=A0A0K2S6H5_CONEP|nr:Conotoxin Superfamily O1 [Conus episcopatus]